MLPKTAFASDAEYTAYLRDWFAGQALANLTASSDAIARASWKDNPEQFVAEWSYRLADAMLAERSKP